MKSILQKRDEDITVVSNPVRLFCDCLRIAAVFSTATSIRNQFNARRLLEAALEEVSAPVYRVQNEETFDGLFDRRVTDEHHTSRTRCTKSRASSP